MYLMQRSTLAALATVSLSFAAGAADAAPNALPRMPRLAIHLNACALIHDDDATGEPKQPGQKPPPREGGSEVPS